MSKRIVSLAILSLLICSPLMACTIFCFTYEGRTYFCNNEDWRDPVTDIRFNPATEGNYAWVYLGFGNNWSQGGVNEHGLCYDWFACGGPLGWQADTSKKYFPGNLSEEMLRKCKNVDEAIEHYQKYNEPSFDTAMTLIADKSGNSVLIQWKDGELVMQRNTDRYQCCGVGKEIIDSKLQDFDDDFDVSVLANALRDGKSVGEFGTKYSNIISLSEGKIFLFQYRNYDQYLEIDFMKKLSEPYSTHAISSLFAPGNQVDGINLVDAAIGNSATTGESAAGERTEENQLIAVEQLTVAFLQKDLDQARREYEAVKSASPGADFEAVMNAIGYAMLNNNRTEDAIEAFILNTIDHPDSANAFDSLGEGYATAGNISLAIENYEKSIELNPDNVAGIKILEELKEKQATGEQQHEPHQLGGR